MRKLRNFSVAENYMGIYTQSQNRVKLECVIYKTNYVIEVPCDRVDNKTKQNICNNHATKKHN